MEAGKNLTQQKNSSSDISPNGRTNAKIMDLPKPLKFTDISGILMLQISLIKEMKLLWEP
jgi:hypothetical protein